MPVSRTAGVAAGACCAGSAGACVAKRFLQDGESPLELLVRRRERRQEADHVAVQAAREDDQPLLARGSLAIWSARSRKPGADSSSSTASAAAHATGLPPNVPPSPPGCTASVSSGRPVTAASGSPPPSVFPDTIRSGSMP